MRYSTAGTDTLRLGLRTRACHTTPTSHPALVARTSEKFGPAVEQIADRHGVEGLRVLDTFGAEAFFCWEHAPENFAVLVEFQKKAPDRVPIAVAVVER